MITPSQYAPFITTVDTTVGQIYTQLSSEMTYNRWASKLPIQGSIFNEGWTGRMPKPRPWFGSRTVYEPAPQTYQITPIPYELTYAIDRFVFEDSSVNAASIFWRMLPDMAYQWVRQPEYELRDLLENAGIQSTGIGNGLGGNRQNGFDGLSIFNTAHPIDVYNPAFSKGTLFSGGTYCNDFIGGQTIGGLSIGGALSTTSFSSLLQYIRQIPDESGEVLGVRASCMMVPTTLEVTARFILKATFMAPQQWDTIGNLGTQVGAGDNQLAKMGVDLIVNPFLTKAQRWYLMDTSHALKPFLWIVREAPRTVPRVNENDPIVFDQHRWLWGAWDRVCPAPNYSWLFYRSGPVGG